MIHWSEVLGRSVADAFLTTFLVDGLQAFHTRMVLSADTDTYWPAQHIKLALCSQVRKNSDYNFLMTICEDYNINIVITISTCSLH